MTNNALFWQRQHPPVGSRRGDIELSSHRAHVLAMYKSSEVEWRVHRDLHISTHFAVQALCSSQASLCSSSSTSPFSPLPSPLFAVPLSQSPFLRQVLIVFSSSKPAALTTFVQRADALEARAAQVDGHIFICTDDQFSGDCTNYGFVANTCSNFPSEFQDDISSVGPDQGWVCTLFMYVFRANYQRSWLTQTPQQLQL